MELPSDYRKLQKLAGEVPSASGQGKKEEIRSSLEEAPEEEVEEAMQELGFSDDEEPESTGNPVKDIVADKATSESSEEPSNSQENGEKEPSLEYTSDRDSTGDMFGRENPEEEVLEQSENSEGEVVLSSEEENQDDSGSESDIEAEEVELDPEVFKYPHILLNKGLRFILGKKFDIQVPELQEEDLEELQRNTEIVAEENLSFQQKQKLQSGSGLFGMVVPHVKQVARGMVSKQDMGENTSDSGEESSENVENQLEEDSGGDTGEPKFGSEHPLS